MVNALESGAIGWMYKPSDSLLILIQYIPSNLPRRVTYCANSYFWFTVEIENHFDRHDEHGPGNTLRVQDRTNEELRNRKDM